MSRKNSGFDTSGLTAEDVAKVNSSFSNFSSYAPWLLFPYLPFPLAGAFLLKLITFTEVACGLKNSARVCHLFCNFVSVITNNHSGI